jgi:hypothetical protein
VPHICDILTIRTRQDYTIRPQGRNPFGRAGYRRCSICRKWRQPVTPTRIINSSVSIRALSCHVRYARNVVSYAAIKSWVRRPNRNGWLPDRLHVHRGNLSCLSHDDEPSVQKRCLRRKLLGVRLQPAISKPCHMKPLVHRISPNC